MKSKAALCSGLVSALALDLCAVAASAPAQAEQTVTVQLEVRNCSSCYIEAGTADMSYPYEAHWSQYVRLRSGKATLTIPTWVTSMQIDLVAKKKGKHDYSAGSARSLLVFKYLGEAEGLPISPRRARTSQAGFICIVPTQGLVVKANTKLVKAKKYKGWRRDPLFQKYEVMFWASPTLSGIPAYHSDGPATAERGIIGAQNTICGAKY